MASNQSTPSGGAKGSPRCPTWPSPAAARAGPSWPASASPRPRPPACALQTRGKARPPQIPRERQPECQARQITHWCHWSRTAEADAATKAVLGFIHIIRSWAKGVGQKGDSSAKDRDMISSADPVGLGAWGRVRGGTTCNRTQQILVVRNRRHASFAVSSPQCHTSSSVVSSIILVTTVRRAWWRAGRASEHRDHSEVVVVEPGVEPSNVTDLRGLPIDTVAATDTSARLDRTHTP